MVAPIPKAIRMESRSMSSWRARSVNRWAGSAAKTRSGTKRAPRGPCTSVRSAWKRLMDASSMLVNTDLPNFCIVDSGLRFPEEEVG